MSQNKSKPSKGATNKRKGNRFELEVVNKIKDCGYKVASSRSQSKATDDNKIDIFDLEGTLPFNIQAKYTQNTPNYFTIRDACTDKSKPFVVVWKKAIAGKISPGTIAMIPIEIFYNLLKLLNNGKN